MMAQAGENCERVAWFERIGPTHVPSPLVISVPHAGRLYPPALLARAAVPREVLEDLEDRHADRLVGPAVQAGAVAIVARAARALIDLNRGEEDLDPPLRQPPGGIATARSRSGLGLLPRRLGRRELWRALPSPAEAAGRIAQVHRPYHEAIAAALAAAWQRHGHAVLIDCHSMPPLAGARAARIVIGDRHGSSAGSGLAARLAGLCRSRGIAAAVNAPYAGAHGIERHGRPAEGIHALQIEIDRTLYLCADRRTVSPGLADAAALIAALAHEAVSATRPGWGIAAE